MPYTLRDLGKGFFLLAAYILSARLGLSLSAVSGFAAPVWLPTGISFAALYLGGRQLWPAVFLGATIANYLTGASHLTALTIGIGNTLEAFLGVYAFQKYVGLESRLERVRDVSLFVGIAGVFATMVSATVGVAALNFSGVIPREALGETWRAWWLGDFLSNLVIAPLFLVWRKSPETRIVRGQQLEGALLAAMVVGLAFAIFFEFPSEDLHRVLRPQWVFLLLIWATLRFGQEANVLMTFTLAIIATAGTVLGRGPYDSPSVNENLLLLQLFMGALALAGLFFGALGREKDNALHIRTEFISIASHELRTPITSLNISLNYLQEELKENGEIEKYDKILKTLDRQTRKLTGLVDSLLNVAKLESGNLVMEKKETDISVLVKDVTQSLGDLFERTNCALELKVQSQVKGKCNGYGLEQVLTNLLMNAMKYGAGSPILVELTEKNNIAVISVKDGGIGIPLEHQSKIFDRYHRVNNDLHSKNLGLGLYITRLIVEAHKGKISVQSEVGKGSTFTVEIPLS